MMKFFEIDERGITNQLSPFFCGIAPCGGEVVYAATRSQAQELYFRYKNGETNLKGEVLVDGQDYPYRNIIREVAYYVKQCN